MGPGGSRAVPGSPLVPPAPLWTHQQDMTRLTLPRVSLATAAARTAASAWQNPPATHHASAHMPRPGISTCFEERSVGLDEHRHLGPIRFRRPGAVLRARSRSQTRTLTVTHETCTMTLTCMSAGRARTSRSLLSSGSHVRIPLLPSRSGNPASEIQPRATAFQRRGAAGREEIAYATLITAIASHMIRTPRRPTR